MKYAGMPFGMWMLFAGSFQKQPTAPLLVEQCSAYSSNMKAVFHSGA